MHTQCNPEQLEFSCVERRRVVAAFDGGQVCSDGGALLLKRTDEAIGLIDRLAGCFGDGRQAGSVEHSVRSMLAQRIFGLALGYEDLRGGSAPSDRFLLGMSGSAAAVVDADFVSLR
jgi:hypothetical protein